MPDVFTVFLNKDDDDNDDDGSFQLAPPHPHPKLLVGMMRLKNPITLYVRTYISSYLTSNLE